jgi:hypothetical protein
MVGTKPDHEQDSLMVGVEDGIVAGISGTVYGANNGHQLFKWNIQIKGLT